MSGKLKKTTATIPAELTDGRQIVVKATTIVAEDPGDSHGKSNVQLEDTALTQYMSQGMIIDPPWDPLVLSLLVEDSTILEPCIASMEVNIDGFGYKFVRRVNIDSPSVDQAFKQEVQAEAVMLENLFANFCIDYSFTDCRRRLRRDREITGNAYCEIAPNKAGRIDQFVHVPSYQMRLTPLEEQETEWNKPRLVRMLDGSIAIETVKTYKRFRRFVQFSRLGATGSGSPMQVVSNPVWFKEWGDPRPISSTTGELLSKDQIKGARLATPMVHHKIYSARSCYGVPRYAGCVITLFGDREADNVNFATLSANNIPSMIIAVSNGSLTQASIDRIKQFVQQQIAGSKNRTRFLLLEASNPYEQQGDSDLTGGTPKLDITPLTNTQIADQLFQVFGDNNRKKVRQAFRLPKIFTGDEENYNKATAETSRKLADEQVFAPERTEEDSWFNRELLPTLGARFHRFLTLGPNVTDDEDLIRVLIAAEKTGGMTPRIARHIIEDIMGQEFPENWKGMDPDVPLTLQLADRMKNLGAAQSSLGRAGVDASGQTEEPARMLKELTEPEQDAIKLLDGIIAFRGTLEKELDRRAKA